MLPEKYDPNLFFQNGSVKGIKLSVSKNGRYFVNQYGEPFFYLADTAWRLFKQLNRQEVDMYLKNRADKGFTVIQAYVLRGLNVKNIYGEAPLTSKEPFIPNEAFFENIDYIVGRVEELGLFMGMVTTFGEHVRRGEVAGEVFRDNESIFDPEIAYRYGSFLGKRYKDKPVIWLFGGDRKPNGDEKVWQAMAKGIKEGCGYSQMVSYHGPGDPNQPSSSCWFHDEAWLDFNTIQSGHGWSVPNYLYVAKDYSRTPVKPTIDMESSYENCIDVKFKSGRRITAHQVREAAYWAVLAGAAGHGYGCCGIWEFNSDKLLPDYTFNFDVYGGTTGWIEAMDFEGAYSMGIMRKLFELRPWYRLIPDISFIISGQGEGEDHLQAAIADDGSFAVIYSPFGNPLSLKMGKLAAETVKASWFNPRNGQWEYISSFDNRGEIEFIPPTKGGDQDWVLVLDDADIFS